MELKLTRLVLLCTLTAVLFSVPETEAVEAPKCHLYELPGCPRNFEPVCGTDGNSYSNECMLCASNSFTDTWTLAIIMSSMPKKSWENDDEELSQEQTDILENNFNKVSKQPDKCLIMVIAAEAGLSEGATEKWFKNRLAKWKRSEGLPSECGSVMD